MNRIKAAFSALPGPEEAVSSLALKAVKQAKAGDGGWRQGGEPTLAADLPADPARGAGGPKWRRGAGLSPSGQARIRDRFRGGRPRLPMLSKPLGFGSSTSSIREAT